MSDAFAVVFLRRTLRLFGRFPSLTVTLRPRVSITMFETAQVPCRRAPPRPLARHLDRNGPAQETMNAGSFTVNEERERQPGLQPERLRRWGAMHRERRLGPTCCNRWFGLTAYSVQQRAREFGIVSSSALNQRTCAIWVLADGPGIAMCDTVIGLAGAFGISQLGEVFCLVSRSNPVVLVAMPLMLVLVALTAMWVPHGAQSGLDPAAEMRGP